MTKRIDVCRHLPCFSEQHKQNARDATYLVWQGGASRLPLLASDDLCKLADQLIPGCIQVGVRPVLQDVGIADISLEARKLQSIKVGASRSACCESHSSRRDEDTSPS